MDHKGERAHLSQVPAPVPPQLQKVDGGTGKHGENLASRDALRSSIMHACEAVCIYGSLEGGDS
jgi:hypothetical protein